MLIIHRCTTCKHPDYWRDDSGRKKVAGDKVDGKQVPAAERRGCCRRSASWGPSETAPRWRALTFEPVTEVLEPGSKTSNVLNAASTCDCDECWALYREVTGTKARRGRHLAAVPG